ncbi:DOMON-like domain-containing protein [Elusimicrobiota bacterium]
MMEQGFSLKSFPGDGLLADLNIKGSVSRGSNKLVICYELHGPLTEIVIPALADTPIRRNELWEKTCFEFFLSGGRSGPYWEFNLSPSGHWNVYHFKDYRREMQEELSLAALPFAVRKSAQAFQLELEFNLDVIVKADQPLNIAVSAVIEHTKGALTYWALTHPGPQPDFHRQDGFIIEL